MPVAIHANQGDSWAFFGVAVVFFLACLAWVLRACVRERDPLPALAMLGGAIASLEEPWIDSMIKLWYPRDAPLVAFTAFHTPQPLYLHLIYPGFVGLGSYVAYRTIRADRGVWWVFGAICLLDLAFELPATAARVFVYYGHQPFQLFHHGWPLWVAPINAAGPALGGFLIYVLAPRVRGGSRALLALMPPLAYAGVYGATGWPEFTMLNGDVAAVVRWLAALVTIGLCCAVVAMLAALRGVGSAGGAARRPDERDERRSRHHGGHHDRGLVDSGDERQAGRVGEVSGLGPVKMRGNP